MHTPTIALSGAAVLLFSAAAGADPAPVDLPRRVRLEYIRGHGAQACEDEGTFRFLITTQMREDPFSAAASARLAVTLERQGAQYQGRAVIDDGNGAVLWTRVGSPGRSCPDVVRDLALAIFFKLDRYDPPAPPSPPKATKEAPSSPHPSSEVPPLPLPSTPITYREEPRPASPSGRRVYSTGGVVGFGIAPSISLGASLAVGYPLVVCIALPGNARVLAGERALSRSSTCADDIADLRLARALRPLGHRALLWPRGGRRADFNERRLLSAHQRHAHRRGGRKGGLSDRIYSRIERAHLR